jgi:hypothetical protein
MGFKRLFAKPNIANGLAIAIFNPLQKFGLPS